MKSKTFHTLIREVLYADNADFLAHSSEEMQYIMDHFLLHALHLV